MKPHEVQETACRVAAMHMRREAAFSEWLQWMAQPFSKILELHREFVYGPVKELVDEVVRNLAPKLVKELAELEVDSDVEEFSRGAVIGKSDRDRGRPASPPSRVSEETIEGYQWGYDNAMAEVPPPVRRRVVEEALTEFKQKFSTQVIVTLLKKIWHAIDPRNTMKAIVAAVKKHGWKLGMGIALFEIFEHFVLPSLLTYITGDPKMLSLATLPIGELIYAVVLRVLGRAPKELDKATPDGHLDWYEAQFGPVKIAALA
jgi:hypothetical protein